MNEDAKSEEETPSDPIERFVAQYFADRRNNVARSLEEYLALFPKKRHELCNEWLRLEKDARRWAERRRDGNVGHFRLERELGEGSFGRVYVAHNEITGQEVALKLLRQEWKLNEQLRLRVRRKSQAMARLNHPNLCRFDETGEHEGAVYIAMENVAGETLFDRTRLETAREIPQGSSWTEGGSASPDTLPVPDAQLRGFGEVPRRTAIEIDTLLPTCIKPARALHAAHVASVIHRDLHPGNIMIRENGEPVIIDFGRAHVENAKTITKRGDRFGAPKYMAPESTIGASTIIVDERSDLFSLGVVLNELITLTHPFDAPTALSVHTAILTKEPLSPRSLNRQISKDLQTVLLTAIEKDRDRRYPSAGDLADDLERVDKHPFKRCDESVDFDLSSAPPEVHRAKQLRQSIECTCDPVRVFLLNVSRKLHLQLIGALLEICSVTENIAKDGNRSNI